MSASGTLPNLSLVVQFPRRKNEQDSGSVGTEFIDSLSALQGPYSHIYYLANMMEKKLWEVRKKLIGNILMPGHVNEYDKKELLN